MSIKSYALAIMTIVALLHPHVANSASNNSVRCVQEMLVNVGYDAGTPDGKLGKRTNNAIKNYLQTQSQKNSKLAALVKEPANLALRTRKAGANF